MNWQQTVHSRGPKARSPGSIAQKGNLPGIRNFDEGAYYRDAIATFFDRPDADTKVLGLPLPTWNDFAKLT